MYSRPAISLQHALLLPYQPTGRSATNPTPTRAFADCSSDGPRLDLSNLQSAVHRYYHQGLATSTQKSYQAGQKHYLSCCSQAKRPPLPTSEQILLMFVSHLAQEGLAHTSIKVYLSAVRNLHISAGLHIQFTKALTPRLELVMKGIKKDKAKTTPSCPRLPITVEIMAKIKKVLHGTHKEHDSIMLWAACCLAFFWLPTLWGVYSANTGGIRPRGAPFVTRHSN